jgi:hypothetical protein
MVQLFFAEALRTRAIKQMAAGYKANGAIG